MSKSDTASLRRNASTANGMANTYSGNAQSTYSVLTPTLNRLAAGGGGYTPGQKADMTTAALQSVGGATAGATGAAANRAATTNNVGADSAFRLAAAHDATGQLSDAALGVQNESAQLAAQQRMQALGEQGQLVSTEGGLANNALGLSTQATNAAEQASENGFWRTATLQAMNNGAKFATGRWGH